MMSEEMQARAAEMIGSRPSDLSPAAYSVLAALRGVSGARTVLGAFSVADVAGLADVAPSTARRAMRRLADLGYVALYAEGDGRWRLSSADSSAAERNIESVEAAGAARERDDALAVRALKQVQSPMVGIADVAARIALPGRPMAGRRSTVRPHRTGVRRVLDLSLIHI